MTPRVFLIMLLTVAAEACVAGRPIQYYRIDPPMLAAGQPPSAPAFGIALQVGNIEAPPLLRDGRILYQVGPNGVGTYEYHRWFETPDRVIQNVLVRLLRSSGKYRSVETPDSSARPDYIVLGRLYEFAEVDKPEVFTRISMEIEIHDAGSRRTVWSRLYTGEDRVSGKEVTDVVQSLDRNLQKGLSEIVAGFDQYFAARTLGEHSSDLYQPYVIGSSGLR
jgi:ABC-type uncharacterized transport system auxiliary subunit